jgi:guanylate kinase
LASSTAPDRLELKPVFAVTGTSGAGKGTLERIVLTRVPELELAISATTRPLRPAEQHGREYYFVSPDEFQRLIDDGAFLEHVDLPWGARSGTLWSEIERIRSTGRAPVLDLETEGALRVQEAVDGAVTIFVKAPTFDELERRLRERATESGGEIEVRLALAREQLAQEGSFDHVILNDDVDRAADELERIVRAELRKAAATMPAHDSPAHR